MKIGGFLHELGIWDEVFIKTKTNGPYLIGPDHDAEGRPEKGILALGDYWGHDHSPAPGHL